MTAARDDDFMALPGMEADSNAHDTARHRSDDTAPASSKSALDALLDEYRARAKSEHEKGTLFEELTRQFLLHDARFRPPIQGNLPVGRVAGAPHGRHRH